MTPTPPMIKLLTLGASAALKFSPFFLGCTFFGPNVPERIKHCGRPCLQYRNIKGCYLALLNWSQLNLTHFTGHYGPLRTPEN